MGCGVSRFEMEFIVENKIETDIENGYDGYCVDGAFPKMTTYGYEIKDKCYGCAVLPYEKLPEGIKLTNERMSPILKEYGYRCDYHTEIRNKGKVPYLTDFTCRKGSPPTSVLLELIKNWGEIVWYGSQGKLIEPEFNGKYGVEVIISSDWAVKNWQPIKIDKKITQWVKLRNVCYDEKTDTYWTIPRENSSKEIGSVVAIGETMEECIKKVNEYAELIEGNNITVQTKYIDELLEEIENGKKQGMEF